MIESAKCRGLVVHVQNNVLVLAIDLGCFPRIRAAREASNAVDPLEARTAWNDLLQTIAHELSIE